MRVHGDIPLGEAWGYLRDHLRPTTPYAADCIAIAHEFEPPSKGHLKRLKRLRLAVTPARKPKPAPQRHSPSLEAYGYARQVREALGAVWKAPEPLPAKPVPPNEPMARVEYRNPIDIDYRAEFYRLDRNDLREMARLAKLRPENGLGARLSPRRVFLAFGDVNALNDVPATP